MSNMNLAPASSAISRNGVRRAGDDELRVLALGEVTHLVEIDALAGAVRARRRHAVGDEPVELSGDRHRRAVREVTTLVESHGEDRVAGIDEGEIAGEVRRSAGVRLHIGMLGAEQGLRPLSGEILDLVSDEVAAVVPLTRVPLRVLVRQHRRRGSHDSERREILRGDELERRPLAVELALEQGPHFGVGGRERSCVGHCRSLPSRPGRALEARRRQIGCGVLWRGRGVR
jgi:hypothetical protein